MGRRKEEVLMGEAGKKTVIDSLDQSSEDQRRGVILASGDERLRENASQGKGE